ncbi:rab proteins geranylgeranyltransferase component A 1 isoform 2-T2 [Polymixia lowei]
MAAEDLPSEFDVVILGTGLVESVVAAACSRVGQRVLHLDRRSYYAANWASFTFNALLSWIEEYNAGLHPEVISDWSSLLEEGEDLICLSSLDPSPITNLQVFCYSSEEEEEDAKSPDAPNTTEEGGAGDEVGATETSEPETTGSEVKDGEIELTEQETTGTQEVQAAKSLPSPAQSQSEPTRKKITYSQLVKEGRRFNIDLVSKLMYSRGPLVDLLIKSNVSRYAEFKNVTRILTYRHGNIEQVPCSRSDVFASRQLSVVEKRMLMRFLTSCLEQEDPPQDYQAFTNRPYLEFLRNQKLTDNLQHFLLHSIAMATEDTSTEDGLASTRHFLRCLGRYGNTPFLFPLYGLGEIPQCFCRCKAVIDSRGQRISCSHFVVEDGCMEKQQATPTRSISRAVLITEASLLLSESDQQVSIVTVPAGSGSPAVRLVELCPSSMTCIPGTYLVHLTCQSVGTAFEDLSPLVTRMFRTPESHDQGRPCVLWSLYFNMADSTGSEVEGHDLPSNVWVCPGPDSSLGHQHAISQAELIFQKIVPDEEFCPPAPNPEDLLYTSSSLGETEEQGEREEEQGEREEEGERQEQGEREEGEREKEGEREEEQGEREEEQGEREEEGERQEQGEREEGEREEQGEREEEQSPQIKD